MKPCPFCEKKVKQLEWDDDLTADALGSDWYSIRKTSLYHFPMYESYYCIDERDTEISCRHTEREAKLACQADFEQRVNAFFKKDGCK